MRFAAWLILLWTLAVAPTDAAAQELDARVLRFGEWRLGGSVSYSRADEQWTNGGEEAFGSEYSLPLTRSTFLPLGPLVDGLSDLFDQTDGPAVPEVALLSAGDLIFAATSSARFTPLAIAVGVLPRVEIGASLPFFQRERLPTFASLRGQMVGVNPDFNANAAALAAVGEEWEAIGRSVLLPVADSEIGMALQQRVEAAGGSLNLPEDSLSAAELTGLLGVEPLRFAATDWAIGDVEIGGRVQLFQTFRETAYPTSGTHLRVAAGGAVRLGTGSGTAEPVLLGIGPKVGFSGISAEGAADLFLGGSFWVTAAGRWTQLSEAELHGFAPTSAPQIGLEPVPLRHDPGARLDLSLISRIRLTPEMSLGVPLRHRRQMEDAVIAGGAVTALTDATSTSIGLSLRYSTLPARDRGGRFLPLEVNAGYRTDVGGSDGGPAIGEAFFRVGVFPRLWGSPAN